MIEKILSRIDEISELIRPVGWSRKIEVVETKAVREIVQEVAKEYGGGWIPVTERLPNIGERVLLFVYGRVHIGKRTDSKSYEHDIFSLENKTLESTRRIEAWMPLPSAPYQKGE